LDQGRKTIQAQSEQIDKELDKYSLFAIAEQRTGIPKIYIFLLLCVVFFLVLIVGIGVTYIARIVTVVYPSFRSFKAISRLEAKPDSPEQLQAAQEKVVKYLMYWVVYAFFNMLEFLLDTVLFWIPFYNALKFIFLIWCVHPRTEGAVKVYENVVAPLLAQHQSVIDGHIQNLNQVAQMTVQELHKDVTDKLKENKDVVVKNFGRVASGLLFATDGAPKPQRFDDGRPSTAGSEPQVGTKKEL